MPRIPNNRMPDFFAKLPTPLYRIVQFCLTPLLPPKNRDIIYGFWWDLQFLNHFNLEKYEVKWQIHWPGEKISLVCTYNTAFSIRGGSRRSHQILLLHDYHETFHRQPDYFQFEKNQQRKEIIKIRTTYDLSLWLWE